MVKPECYTDKIKRSIIIYPSLHEIILKNTSEKGSLFSEDLDSILELINPLIESKEAKHYYYEGNKNEVHVILGNLSICIDYYSLNISNKTYTKYLVHSSFEKTRTIFDKFLDYYNNVGTYYI